MHVSIRIKGHLDPGWQEWLEGLQIVHEPDGTSRLSGTLPGSASALWSAHEDRSFELDTALARKQRTGTQRGLILSFSKEQGRRTVAFQERQLFLLAQGKRNLGHKREEHIMRKVMSRHERHAGRICGRAKRRTRLGLPHDESRHGRVGHRTPARIRHDSARPHHLPAAGSGVAISRPVRWQIC